MRGHSVVTVGEKTLHSCCSGHPVQRSFSWLGSIQKMVLKWLLIGETDENSSHSLFRSPGRHSSSDW